MGIKVTTFCDGCKATDRALFRVMIGINHTTAIQSEDMVIGDSVHWDQGDYCTVCAGKKLVEARVVMGRWGTRGEDLGISIYQSGEKGEKEAES